MTDHRYFDSPARNTLPSHLFDVYLRYKQGTRAIVAWLVSQRPVASPNSRSISIGDLWDLAKIAQAKSKPLPYTIDFHFRETISARKRLTQYFREKSGASLSDRSTTDHEFFTNNLSQIYAILCNCNRPLHHEPNEAKQARHRCSDPLSNNVFDVLEVVQSEGSNIDTHDTEHCEACHDPEVTAEKSEDVVELADDQLGETLEIMKIFKDIRDVCDTVNRAWEQAAREEIPIVLAALVASVGFTYLKGYESQVQLRWDIHDTTALHDRVEGMKIPVAAKRQQVHETVAFELGVAERHREVWNAFLQFKDIAPSSSCKAEIPACHNAANYILQDRTRSSESISMFLGCITDLKLSGTTNSIVQLNTPVFSDALHCLRENTDRSCPLRCTTGLMMLYEGFQSFLWPEGNTYRTKARPRVQALRFAEEVRESIIAVLENSTMPCRCCYTLAANLETFQLDLEAFLREKNFNLFFQAPWVSGSHILDILEKSFSYGMRLCSYRHYLGAVLHLYNLLTSSGQMLQIALLEVLCDVFGDTVFPGGRPRTRFSACYLRFKGGRLRQSRKHRNEWHLAVTKTSAREAAGFGLPGEPVVSRFQAKKLSLLHYIKLRDYNLDEDIWEKIHKHKAGSKHKTSSLEVGNGQHSQTDDQGAKRRDSGCCVYEQAQDNLLEMQRAIASSELVVSSSNPLPIARINIFKVYLAAVRAVSAISDKHHEEQPAGKYCLCFVEELLRRGDEIHEDNMAGRLSPFGYKSMINLCEDAIVSAFDVQQADWSQYMWSHL